MKTWGKVGQRIVVYCLCPFLLLQGCSGGPSGSGEQDASTSGWEDASGQGCRDGGGCPDVGPGQPDANGLDARGGDGSVPSTSDASFIYRNGVDIRVAIEPTGAIITRLDDGKVLVDCRGQAMFRDYSDGNLRVSVSFVEKPGGFDVEYSVENPTDVRQKMPDLLVPGIRLSPGRTLSILNPYFLYLEERSLDDEIGHSDYFAVAYGIYRYEDGQGNEVVYEDEKTYGAMTNGAYAPVIVAHDGDFAVGTSVDYPFLEYRDTTESPTGRRRYLRDKLYPLMRIVREQDNWTYVYVFQHGGSESYLDGYVPPHTTFSFTLPVRVSPPRYWLLTLYPYRDYFRATYPRNGAPTRDVSPILWVHLAYQGNATDPANPRGWSWYLNNVDDQGQVYLPLYQVMDGLRQAMLAKGWRRVLLHCFSGAYAVPPDNEMYGELPFQFMDNLPDYLTQDLPEALDILHDSGLRYYVWWGIAGMIPVDESGDVIPFDRWIPAYDVVHEYGNPEHDDYARHHLQRGLHFHVDGLGLDAYIRMEEAGAMAWLDEMKATAPTLHFIAELQQDIYHTRASIFVQRYGDSFTDRNRITQPPVLAQYLNPNVEVVAYIQDPGLVEDLPSFARELARMGYTPAFTFSEINNRNPDVTQRLLDSLDSFVDVTGIDNSTIASCFNGIDDDGDGTTDWPYDADCSTPMADEAGR